MDAIRSQCYVEVCSHPCLFARLCLSAIQLAQLVPYPTVQYATPEQALATVAALDGVAWPSDTFVRSVRVKGRASEAVTHGTLIQSLSVSLAPSNRLLDQVKAAEAKAKLRAKAAKERHAAKSELSACVVSCQH